MGLYFVAAGTGLIASRDELQGMFRDLAGQPALGYLGGLIAFGIGGAIVASHNIWGDILSGFVSLIGWIALAEGVLMLSARKWFLGLFERMTLSRGFATGMGVATIAAGAALLWAGLLR